jgi:hypothetical protein
MQNNSTSGLKDKWILLYETNKPLAIIIVLGIIFMVVSIIFLIVYFTVILPKTHHVQPSHVTPHPIVQPLSHPVEVKKPTSSGLTGT